MKKFPAAIGGIALAVSSTLLHASGGGDEPLGPFPSTAPAIELAAFGAGHLGLFDGSFQRPYRIAAWRVLDSRPLSPAEAGQLSHVLDNPPGYTLDQGNEWAEAKKKFGLPDSSAPNYYTGMRELKLANGASNLTESYVNCSSVATRTAAQTLADRAQKYSDAKSNKWVAEWIKGQEQVFANCDGGMSSPGIATGDAPPWFRYDRAYQIAAAYFYSDQFELARDSFTAIAKDKASPWAELAPYLAARSELRLGSLSTDDKIKAKALKQAQDMFRALESGTASPNVRRLAHEMLFRVAIELDRPGTFLALERTVGEQPWGPDATIQVGDYITLYRNAPAANTGTLNDWLASLPTINFDPQSNGEPAPRTESLAAYKAARANVKAALERVCGYAAGTAHRKAWAIACYAQAQRPGDVPQPVRAFAASLPAADPAWPMLTYFDLRQQMYERQHDGKPQAAAAAAALRQRFDGAIAQGDAVFGADGINALRALRAPLATDAVDFLASWTVREIGDPPGIAWHTALARQPGAGSSLFPTAYAVMSSSVPVSVLSELAANPKAGAENQRNALVAAWTRAAMLNEDKALERLSPVLAKDKDYATPVLDYQKAADPVQKRYELARIMLRQGATPTFGGTGWGCEYPKSRSSLAWLSPEQVKESQQEFDVLVALPTTITYIGRAVLEWSKVAPADPRLAGDLADVVAKTRLGCQGETVVSRAAFTALHKLFPKSPEAKRTKYYF